MRPAIYIPNLNGADRLGPVLRALGEQTVEADVALVDNGSTDGSVELARRELSQVKVVALGENLGFGRAINRAVAEVPGDPLILLNNDAVPEAGFVEALLGGLTEGVESVAGLLLQERSPELIDSAGVVADATLMGFDYLHGERAEVAATAAPPLGPTGGGALYRRAAFEALGGFDERIFLYYEDLDLALRLAARGGRCALAPQARAVHAYSASLGAASARKYEWTGWSRGYMLRRYGVMRDPRLALRALTCEGALCAGQLLGDRTTGGLRGRLRGWRAAAGLPSRRADDAALLDLSARQALALRRRRRATS